MIRAQPSAGPGRKKLMSEELTVWMMQRKMMLATLPLYDQIKM